MNLVILQVIVLTSTHKDIVVLLCAFTDDPGVYRNQWVLRRNVENNISCFTVKDDFSLEMVNCKSKQWDYIKGTLFTFPGVSLILISCYTVTNKENQTLQYDMLSVNTTDR